MDSLWNFNQEEITYATPKEIIEEQAEYLAEKTSENISAKVVEVKKNLFSDNSKEKDFSFEYNFIIEAKYIPNYKLKLFRIGFDIPVYPVYVKTNSQLNNVLQDYVEFLEGYKIESEQEFITFLKIVLSSNYVNNVISTLLKMSKEFTDHFPF